MTAKNFEIKAYSKAELAAAYGVSVATFIKWQLQAGIGCQIRLYCKIYTPKEVSLIVEKLGEP